MRESGGSEDEPLGSSNSGRALRLLSNASAINQAWRAAKSSRQTNKYSPMPTTVNSLTGPWSAKGGPPLSKGCRIVAPHQRDVQLLRADQTGDALLVRRPAHL